MNQDRTLPVNTILSSAWQDIVDSEDTIIKVYQKEIVHMEHANFRITYDMPHIMFVSKDAAAIFKLKYL